MKDCGIVINNVVYCNFSYRRPEGKNYGIFAVAFYKDSEYKMQIKELQKTVALSLWADQQYIASIQSYKNALEQIYLVQNTLMNMGVTHVVLVTNNSTLAGWIINPNKRRDYAPYMKMANAPYRPGGEKEISLNIALANTVYSEKSRKYCREDLICNTIPSETEIEKERRDVSKFVLDTRGLKTMSVADVINSNNPECKWEVTKPNDTYDIEK